jgi:hypothetical protein
MWPFGARSGANKETTLIVSLLWIVYNMIPPYLLIHYTFIGRGSTLNFMSKCAAAAKYLATLPTCCKAGSVRCSNWWRLLELQRRTDSRAAVYHLSCFPPHPLLAKSFRQGVGTAVFWHFVLVQFSSFLHRVAFLTSFVCGIGALVIVWLLYPKDIAYGTALKESYLFYNAQIGTLPANYPISWRGNAYLQVGCGHSS